MRQIPFNLAKIYPTISTDPQTLLRPFGVAKSPIWPYDVIIQGDLFNWPPPKNHKFKKRIEYAD